MSIIYRDLIYSNIYSRDYVEKVAERDYYWTNAGWQEREWSLRHDYACRLLCNTIHYYDGEQEIDDHISASRSAGSSSSSKTAARNLMATEGWSSDEDLDYAAGSPILLPDDDEEMLEGVEPVTLSKYRFIHLEGAAFTGLSQSNISRGWGIEPPKGHLDIADMRDEVFIEVKISSMPVEDIWEDCLISTGLPEAKLVVIKFSPNGIMEVMNHDNREYTLPGTTTCLNFLACRKIWLAERGIKKEAKEDTGSRREVMSDGYLLNAAGKWIEQHLLEESSVPRNVNEGDKVLTYKVASPKHLLPLMPDVESRGGDMSLYKSRLLPPTAVVFELLGEKDRDVNFEFISLLYTEDEVYPIPVNVSEERAEWLWKAVLDVKDMVLKDSVKDLSYAPFSYIDVKRKMGDAGVENEKYGSLLGVLGVGACGRHYTSNPIATKQEEYKDHKPARWVDFLTETWNGLMEDHGLVTESRMNYEEIRVKHPLALKIRSTCTAVHNQYSSTNAALFASLLSGFYSRMGGAYIINLQGGKATSNTGIAVVPIVAPHKDGKRHYCQGVAVRGPHHVRDASDRINLLVIEQVNNQSKLVDHTKGIKVNIEGRTFMIRQNAVKKTDASYLSFVENHMFVLYNYVGELVFKSALFQTSGIKEWARIQAEIIGDKMGYLRARISENILYAVLGGSQEEGYAAFRRKMYMILDQMSRGRNVSLLNLEGFMEKGTECLIDSCYVLWTHTRLRNTIYHVVKNGFEL